MRGAIDLAFFHFVSVVGFNAYIARLRDKHEVPLQLDQYQRQPEITATCRHNTTDSAAYNPSTTNKPASHLVSSSLPGGHLEMGGVLVVRRKTGGDDGPKIGRLELVSLGKSSHGCLQEVTLGSGRSLGLGCG
jgi:hypothetical protein